MAEQLGINLIGVLERPSLFAGDFHRVAVKALISGASGAQVGDVIPEGTILGLSDFSMVGGNAIMSAIPATDDDYTLAGILAKDVTVEDDAVIATVWTSGEFLIQRVVLNGTATPVGLLTKSQGTPLFFHYGTLAIPQG